MFEGQLTAVLNRTLGAYVHGISSKDLSVAVLSGNIVLKNLRMKADALNALGMPFDVRAGVVGKLTLQVPWRALGRQPVIATLDEVYVVAGFASQDASLSVEEKTKRWNAAQAELKRKIVDEGELAWLAANAATGGGATKNAAAQPPANDGDEGGGGWLAGMLDTILGNLEVRVTRIHLRLEDDLGGADGADGAGCASEASSASNPFAAGVTLESLSVSTVDADGAESFSVKGLAERMRKSATLSRLAIYFDVGAKTLRPLGTAAWKDVASSTLAAVMEPGTTSRAFEAATAGSNVPTEKASKASKASASKEDVKASALAATEQASRRSFLLAPASARARYERRGKIEAASETLASQRVYLRVDSLAATLKSSHLRVLFYAVERLERDARRAPHAHLRPSVSVRESPRAWWTFATAAAKLRRSVDAAERGGELSVHRAMELMRARRAYVDAYAARALSKPRPKKVRSGERWPRALAVGEAPEIDAIEASHPAHSCVLFRALAHQRLKQTTGDDVQDGVAKASGGGWFSSWTWGSSGKKDDGGGAENADGGGDGEMSAKDWDALQKIFDVEGHAAAAAAAASAVSDDALQAEYSVRVGSMSLELVDDESGGGGGASRQNVVVLHSAASGFVAGSRAFGAARADHRLIVSGMELTASGSTLARVRGGRASRALDDRADADDTARILWGSGADGDSDSDDDDDAFADASADVEDLGLASGTDDDARAAAPPPPHALSVKFENKPKPRSPREEDETSTDAPPPPPDIVVAATVAPAYLTVLRAPVDRVVAVLTRHKSEALAAQEETFKRAVAASASATAAAAQERVLAALSERPVIDASVVIHTPHVAVPSRPGLDAATLLLDLGRLRLRSRDAVELGVDVAQRRMFSGFAIEVSEISASIARGVSDANDCGVGGANPTLAFEDASPLLPSFGARATVLQALAPVPGRASLDVTFTANALRAAVSPRRIDQLVAIAEHLSSSSERISTGGYHGGGDDDDDVASLAGSDFTIGSDVSAVPGDGVKGWILQVSFGRLQWTPCLVKVNDLGKVEIFAAGVAGGLGAVAGKPLAAPTFVTTGGALKLRASDAAGKKHAMIVSPDAASTTSAMERIRAAAGTGATSHFPDLVKSNRVVRFKSSRAMTRVKEAINAGARNARASAGIAVAEGDEPAPTEAEPTRDGAAGSAKEKDVVDSIRFTATLSELSIVVAAPLDAPLSTPAERASSASTLTRVDTMSSEHADEFYDANDDVEWWRRRGGGGGGGADDDVERALARIVLSDVGATYSQRDDDVNVALSLAAFTVHDAYASDVTNRRCTLLTTGAASRVGGKGGGENENVFHVTYASIAPGSSAYAGVDAEIAAVLGPLSMSIRRPTLAALAAFPSLLGGARASGSETTTTTTPTAAAAANADVVAAETGKSRVAMAVTARVDALRLALLLEDAEDDDPSRLNPGCVLEAKITDMDAALTLYPSTTKVEASMGTLRVTDPRLPPAHPYRHIVNPSRGGIDSDASAGSSLVTASYESFDEGEQADGALSSVAANVASLRVVFLYRLVTEISDFFDGLSVAIAAPAASSSSSKATTASSSSTSSSTSPSAAMRLDIAMDAPVIVVPRLTSDVSLALELDMGALGAKNALTQTRSTRPDAATRTAAKSKSSPGLDSLACSDDEDDDADADEEYDAGASAATIVDRTAVRLSGVNVVVVGGDAAGAGPRRVPLMRSPAAAEAVIWRRLGGTRDADDDTPETVVRADVEPLIMDISAEDFRLLSTCVLSNMAEKPSRMETPANPLRFPRGVATTDAEDAFRATAAASGPLGTLEEGETETGDEDDAVVNAAAPPPHSRFSLARDEPAVVLEGPTVVTTRLSVRVALMELALYRGGGRGEPLATLSVHELSSEVCVLDPDTYTARASVAAVELEDLRYLRSRLDGGGGGGGGSGRLVAFGGCPSAERATISRERGGLLPLLQLESTTGPAVGGTRAGATLQRFTLEVEPTFLLDVGRVFYPTLAGGGGEAPEEVLPRDIALAPGVVHALDADVVLSKGVRIVADGGAGGEYVLDGGGRALRVREADVFSGPVIFVGPKCVLTLKNVLVEIEAACGAKAAWPFVVKLAAGARCVAAPEDKVSFASSSASVADCDRELPASALSASETAAAAGATTAAATATAAATRTTFSFRATCLELRVVGDGRGNGDAGDNAGEDDAVDFTLGVNAEYVSETRCAADGGDTDTDVQLQLARVGVRQSSGSDGNDASDGDGDILAPVDVTMRYAVRADKNGVQDDDARITLGASPLSFSLSNERVELLSRLSARLASAFASAPVAPCRVFNKVWSSDELGASADDAAGGFDEGVGGSTRGAAGWSIWRPRPPSGYAPLGDVVALGVAKPPADPVTVIRASPAFTSPPLAFEHAGTRTPPSIAAAGLVAWTPTPPPGFVALGVVCAPEGSGPPPLDAMRCVRRELVVAAEGVVGRACAGVGEAPLWVVNNAARTCVAGGARAARALDLRVPTGLPGEKRGASGGSSASAASSSTTTAAVDVDGFGSNVPLTGVTAAPVTMTVVDFERVWWDFKSGAKTRVSVWRPKVPRGWGSFGDVAVNRLEPPVSTVVVRVIPDRVERGASGRPRSPPTTPPIGYHLVWKDSGFRAGRSRHKQGTISFWRPVPQDGYVAIGDVASPSHASPPKDAVVCLRADLARALPQFAFSEGAAWTSAGAHFKLGKRPVALFHPNAFSEDWTSLGTFLAAHAEEGKSLRPPEMAYAPEYARWKSPTDQDGGGGGYVFSTRLDVLDATVFADAAARRAPLARLSLRRVSVDAKLTADNDTTAEVSCTTELSHFNARTAAWEPVVEPWSLVARYADVVDALDAPSKRRALDFTPPGYTLRVDGAGPLRTVITHAFLDDLIGAYAASMRAGGEKKTTHAAAAAKKKKMNENDGDGVVNATGRRVWTRAKNGVVTETKPGGILPGVGVERAPPASLLANGAEDGVVSPRSRPTSSEPCYALIEVLACRAVGVVESLDAASDDDSVPPPPLRTLRFSLDGVRGDGGVDHDHAACTIALEDETSTGAALVDVVPWRLANANANANDAGDAFGVLRLRAEVTHTSHGAIQAALGESRLDARVASSAIDVPSAALLRAASAETWFPSDDGEWYELEPSAASGSNRRPRVRLRVRLVEGLQLRSPRARTPLGAAAMISSAMSSVSGDFDGLAIADAGVGGGDGGGGGGDGGAGRLERLKLYRAHQLELVWWSRNSGSILDVSGWHPVCPPGTALLGTSIVAGFNAPNEALIARAPWLDPAASVSSVSKPSVGPSATAPPVGFARVYADSGKRWMNDPNGTVAIWHPEAPPGYVAVGCVVTPDHQPPDPTKFACVRADLAAPSAAAPAPLWSNHGAHSKLGNEQLALYRTGVAGGAGWTAVSSHSREDVEHAEFPPFEIRWDVAAGASVEEASAIAAAAADDADADDDAAVATIGGPNIALAPNGPWAPVGSRRLGAATAAAVALGPARATAVVLDRRLGTLRAPATATSHLPFEMEARLVTLNVVPDAVAGGAKKKKIRRGGGGGGDAISDVADVYESERFYPFVGWTEPKGNLDEYFTGRFGELGGANSTSHFPDVPLPEGWRWDGPWELDRGVSVDANGWAYGANWVTKWGHGSGSRGIHVTRRRRWTRRRAPIDADDADDVDADDDDRGKLAADPSSWSGVLRAQEPGRPPADPLPLPLGCGGAAAGGSTSLGLDVRIPGRTEWARRDPAAFGSAWPIPIGRLAPRPRARDGDPVVNGHGPWLAECVDAAANAASSSSSSSSNPTTFVVFTAEPDLEVSSIAGVDALRGGRAWRLAAHAPVTIQTALPCACAFVLRAPDASAVATGVARPGAPCKITSADPRVPLALELTPLMPDGSPAGTCASAVPLRGGGPVAELCVVGGGGGDDGGTLRLAVAVDFACAPSPGAAAPPLLVDVRAPLMLANGCPFSVRAGALEAVKNRPIATTRVDAGAQRMLPTPQMKKFAKKSDGGHHRDDDDASLTARRTIYIAAAAHDGSAFGNPARVEIEPGAEPTRALMHTPSGPVLARVSSQPWAPKGASAAAPRPCLRVSIAPSLSIVNLSSVAVAVSATGATTQTFAPGQGPWPVLHAPERPRGRGGGGGGGGGDDDDDVEIAFAIDDAPSSAPLSVAEVAASATGMWISPPARGGAAVTATVAALHVAAETTAEGCRLLVLRGGSAPEECSAASLRVANRTWRDVSVRQVRRKNGADGAEAWDAIGPWLRVSAGSCTPWALSDPSAAAAAAAAGASISTAPSRRRREREIVPAEDDVETGGEGGENDEDDDDDDDDDGYFLAGYDGDAADDASSRPNFVEVCVGDVDDVQSARARVSLPSASASDAMPTDPLDRPAAIVRDTSGGASAHDTWHNVYAVRRVFDADAGAGAGVASIVVARHAASGVDAGEAERALLPAPKRRQLVRESHVEISLPVASLSVVDGADELLLASLDGFELASRSGLGPGGGSAAIEVAVRGVQVDDQCPRAAFPVIAYHNPAHGPLFRAFATTAPIEAGGDGEGAGSGGGKDARHPAISVNVTRGGVHLRVHEPFLWRLSDFAARLRSERMTVASGGKSGGAGAGAGAAAAATAAAADPVVVVGAMRISPIHAKITFKPSPDSRPNGVGPAVSSVLAFLNLDRLPIHIGEFRRARERARSSALSKQVYGHVKAEVLKQTLQVLASVNHLGNVAGTLDQFGDKIRDLGGLIGDDVIGGESRRGRGDDGGGGGGGDTDLFDDLTGGRVNVVTGAARGTGELAKGVLGGVAGIFTKAGKGFKKSGVQGFARGAAQGVVGLGTNTAAGAVNFVARVVEGVDATIGTAQDTVKGGQDAAAATRRRLPLAVRGDGVVRPWTQHDANGLRLLRVARAKTDAIGGKTRPFASDRFEASLAIADGRVLLLSNARVGVVAAAEERVEWVLTWAQVASVRVGEGGDDDGGAVVAIRARGDGARAMRLARCENNARAREVVARVGDVWAAARAASVGGGGGGGAGGGF